ncbi:MAG TPA: DUF4124 domain-containing protein [Burkholderiales bacterium]
MRLQSGLLVLALGLTAWNNALAEEVYKSTMPDGSVVYGESPQPGAKRVEKIDARAAVNGAIVATPADMQRANELNAHASSPGVTVIPQARRDPAPPLQQGTINPPGVMPKRSY